MNADEAIDYIRDAVRKVIPSTCDIEFSGGQSGGQGICKYVRIDAWLGTDRLSYDQLELAQLLEANSVEADGDEYALFAGTVHGVHYELRLFAEPQVVSTR
jgi:hypothetical protein